MKKKICGILVTMMSISLCFGCGNDSDKKEKVSESIVTSSEQNDSTNESIEKSTTESVVEGTSDNTSEQETTFVEDITTSKEVAQNETTSTKKEDSTTEKQETTKKQETTTKKQETTTKKQETTTKKQETTTKKQETTTKKQETTTKKQETTTTTCNHNYVDATCNSPAKCSKCGKTSGKELGHNYIYTGECEHCGQLHEDACTYITMNDYMLKQCFDENSDGQVSLFEITRIGRLGLYDGITNLEGLEHAINLENIVIDCDNDIENLDIIGNLPKLDYVEYWTWYNRNLDFSFIKNSTSITYVEILRGTITKEVGMQLSLIKNLDTLYFYSCHVENISFLKGNTNIKNLGLEGIETTLDLSYLLEMEGLEFLSLFYDEYSDEQKDIFEQLQNKGVDVFFH